MDDSLFEDFPSVDNKRKRSESSEIIIKGQDEKRRVVDDDTIDNDIAFSPISLEEASPEESGSEKEEEEEESFHLQSLDDGFHYFEGQGKFNPCNHNPDAKDRDSHPFPLKTFQKTWHRSELSKLKQGVEKLRFVKRESLWEMVQSKYFPNETANTCRLIYEHYIDPKYDNSESFSKQQDNELLKSAIEHGERDWEAISKQVSPSSGKQKTVWSCMKRYLKLKDSASTAAFTTKEDSDLLNLVDKFGDHNWPLVSDLNACLGNRSRNQRQLASRYRQISNRTSAKYVRWTVEEDDRLMKCIKIYPDKDWVLIQRHIPGKTDMQCRDRYISLQSEQMINKKVNDDGKRSNIRWKPEEDNLLLELVKKLGQGKWASIARSFNERSEYTFRSNKMIAQRYNILTNKKTKKPKTKSKGTKCKYILTKGKNKGMGCDRNREEGKEFCKIHHI